MFEGAVNAALTQRQGLGQPGKLGAFTQRKRSEPSRCSTYTPCKPWEGPMLHKFAKWMMAEVLEEQRKEEEY